MLQAECRVLERRSPNEVVLDVFAPKALVHFEGHFPELPILPGVVQIDWAIALAREHCGVQGEFAALEGIKFQAVVRPEAALRLTLRWDQAISKLSFDYSQAGKTSASGKVVLCA
jgi:3-hydroxymyristoyl/3-hydroxydecanoyl-(acyl carrier protein) dehydratase